MHAQLEILLELQDLKAQKRELEEAAEDSARQIEEKVFQVEPQNAVRQLQAKIDEMEANLEPGVAGRYRLLASRPRAVAPVLNGVCYGCFMTMPTAIPRTNELLRWCDNCGSFVYFVD